MTCLSQRLARNTASVNRSFFWFFCFFKVEQAPSAACPDHEGDHLLEILQPQLPWQCKELLPLASHLPDLTREHRPESHCKAGWGGGRLIEDFYCYYFQLRNCRKQFLSESASLARRQKRRWEEGCPLIIKKQGRKLRQEMSTQKCPYSGSILRHSHKPAC